ncbi:MAG: TonB-dependent receptor plug domain-containing protein [Woeseiaceae bacterium]|nr:TonB-dependent receptor plug domain-containing protein [Woeseiaceae bacterium]
MMTARLRWLTIVAATFVAMPSGATADDALEEIVVTADFRGRVAADLPSSVTVIDAEEIRASTVQHFEELVYRVPNLNWSGDGNRARYFQIRGVGELEQYEGAPNPSVGFIIDDIDFSGIGGIATLFDVERVEVLRGPQGTRYGANALAGLVYVQSAAADGERDLRARLSAGGDGLAAGGIAFGAPLGDAAFRMSAQHHESDGFRRNPWLGRDDTNGRSETSLRGKLAWEAGNDWSFRLAGLWVDVDDGYDAFALDNSLTVLSDRPGRDAQRSRGASLRAERRLDDARRLTAITSYAQSDIEFSFDADWGNPSSWAPFVYDFTSDTRRERRTLGQELRLSMESGDGGGYTVGAYGLVLDETLRSVNQGIYEDPVVFNFTDTLDERVDSDFEALNLALFGQASVPLGPGVLTVGLRAEHRGTNYADSDGLRLDPAETMLGGEVAWVQPLGDAQTAWITLSRGYKAGGFNLGIAPPGRREFDQEALWNLEAGIRSNLLDGRLGLDASVFYSRRIDQQVRSSEQLNPNDPASFVFFTDNAARGELAGLEAMLRYYPADSLELYASLGLLHSEFTRFDGDDGRLEGREQAHAPGYSVALGGEYRHASGGFLRIDATARDDYFFDVSHDQRSQPFELVNLRAGYRAERWTATLWARNLFDEAYAVRGFFFGNEPPDFPPSLYVRRGDPRQLGVTFDIQF